MSLALHTLKPAAGSTHKEKRIGRGTGSGHGGTSGRGNKGAQSRSGYSRKMHFEGGQMPLQRRVPKFGFKNPNRVEYKVINLDVLQEMATQFGVASISLEFLAQHGIVSKNDIVKVLGRGELAASLTVEVNAFSASAVAAIEKAGGKAVVVRATN